MDSGIWVLALAAALSVVLNVLVPVAGLIVTTLLATVPILAIAYAGVGLRKDAKFRPQWGKVVIGILITAITMGTLALRAPETYDRDAATFYFLGFAALYSAAFFAAAFRFRKYPANLGGARGGSVALAGSTLFGLGLMSALNELGPHSSLGVHRGIVIEKHIGRRNSTYLSVAFPEGHLPTRHFPTYIDDFGDIRVGDPYCLELRDGFLGLRVYRPVPCTAPAVDKSQL